MKEKQAFNARDQPQRSTLASCILLSSHHNHTAQSDMGTPIPGCEQQKAQPPKGAPICLFQEESTTNMYARRVARLHARTHARKRMEQNVRHETCSRSVDALHSGNRPCGDLSKEAARINTQNRLQPTS
jgi:hypothetical protein